MDKPEFVQKAPLYYALGIATTIANAKGTTNTITQLDNLFSTQTAYLEKEVLIDQAAKLLREHEVIEIIPDDFGPVLYRGTEKLGTWLESGAPEEYPLFRKFRETGASMGWLRSALRSVNKHYEQLGITANDFNDGAAEVQWEPIPLDRNDDKLRAATDALDTAINEIQADNGYAIHAPLEREYVLSNLKAASKSLKEQTQIYWTQLKVFALEPLAQVIKRFGTAAVGVAATAARQAIVEWLKGNFSTFIDWL